MIKKLCIALVAMTLGTLSSMATATDSIYVDNTSLAAGKSGVIKVKIKNNSNVQSVGVYLVMPEGFTFDASKVALNETMAPAANDTIAANTISGATRVAILGKGGAAFGAMEGDLFTIPVTVDASVAKGTYNLTISNAELSTTSNAVINLASATATITVGDGTSVVGDENGDGSVNVLDVNTAVSKICNSTSPTYSIDTIINAICTPAQ